LGKEGTEFTIGSRAIPLPIHLDLRPITEALNEIWWGGTRMWRKNNIFKKQRNLMRALKSYPKYVQAKKNTGGFITIIIV
jgi:predicted membrane chloride channel (bestrophin family)